MPIAFVQSTTGNSATTPTTTTAFAGSTVTGNAIIVGVGDDSAGTTTVLGVTDNKGNTYTRAGAVGANASSVQLWYAQNVTGGASHTVSVAWDEAATGRVSVIVQEFSGLATTGMFDQVSTAATGTGTTATGGTTPTTTQADELVVMVSSHAATISAYSVGATYSNLAQVSVADAQTAMQSKVVAVTGTQTGSMGIAASRAWVGMIATFKGAAAPATTARSMMMLGVGV